MLVTCAQFELMEDLTLPIMAGRAEMLPVSRVVTIWRYRYDSNDGVSFGLRLSEASLPGVLQL